MHTSRQGKARRTCNLSPYLVRPALTPHILKNQVLPGVDPHHVLAVAPKRLQAGRAGNSLLYRIERVHALMPAPLAAVAAVEATVLADSKAHGRHED